MNDSGNFWDEVFNYPNRLLKSWETGVSIMCNIFLFPSPPTKDNTRFSFEKFVGRENNGMLEYYFQDICISFNKEDSRTEGTVYVYILTDSSPSEETLKETIKKVKSSFDKDGKLFQISYYPDVRGTLHGEVGTIFSLVTVEGPLRDSFPSKVFAEELMTVLSQ